MQLIKRLLLGWRLTLPIGGRRIAIPIVLTGLLLCCCGPFSIALVDASIRQAGLAPTYTPRPTNTARPTSSPRATRPPTQTARATATSAPAEATLDTAGQTRARSAEIAITPEPPSPAPAPSITPAPELTDPTPQALPPPTAPIVDTPTPLPTPTETRAPLPTAAPAGPVAARNANLRAGPGITYPVIGSARPGQDLEITGRNQAGDWYQLASGAWIAGALVTRAPNAVPLAANMPPPPAPTAAPVRSAPVITLPAAANSNCDCSSNTYNCDDFVAFDAQSCYMRCLQQTGRDVHQLDGDNDGSACEWTY